MERPCTAATTAARDRARRVRIFKAICVLLPLVAGLCAVEAYFRLARKTPDYWTVAQLESTAPGKKLPFTFDPELGFRPALQESGYNALGVKANNYVAEKSAGVHRVLFLGDSVTARGRLITALRSTHGDDNVEYWNAGVEAFDTCQEAGFYESCNSGSQPDHVVLTFHNNDFSQQVVVNFNDDGCIAFYGAETAWRVRLPWLLRQSEFVRWAVVAQHRKRSRARAAERVEKSLQTLAASLAEKQIEFSVVLFPILKPRDAWSSREVASREQAIAIFEKLGIRYFDVLPALEQALREGVDVCETPGDKWHPSDAVCDRLARQLRQDGLLDRSAAGWLAWDASGADNVSRR